MSVSGEISIDDKASPLLRRALQAVRTKRPLHQALASGAAREVQGHFRGLAATNKNRFGARSTFWRRMLAGTTAEADDQAGIVRMPPEVGLRYYGGTVRPVAAKALTIPATRQAYGKSARDFSDLEYRPILRGKLIGALVQRESTTVSFRPGGSAGGVSVRRGARTRGGKVFYWLVKSATIKPNKDLLPTEEELAAAAVDAAEGFIRRRLSR